MSSIGTTIPNETLQAFQRMQGTFQAATAEIGGQAEWPEAGMHAAYVTSMDLGMGEFIQTGGTRFPATSIAFHYKLINDPTRAEPLEWKGAIFNLPIDANLITVEGSKQRASIEMNRLKGFIKVLLNREPGELAADMMELDALINQSATAVAVTVNCQHKPSTKPNNKSIYRTDYIKEVLAIGS